MTDEEIMTHVLANIARVRADGEKPEYVVFHPMHAPVPLPDTIDGVQTMVYDMKSEKQKKFGFGVAYEPSN